MSETTDIKINELMNKIVQCTGGKRVAILEGFVSSVDEDIIKLHPGLNPSRYVEIPRDSLLHSTTIDDELGNRCKLWVEYDTKIVTVRRDMVIIDDEVTDSETGEVAMVNIFSAIKEIIWSGAESAFKGLSCVLQLGRYSELKKELKDASGEQNHAEVQRIKKELRALWNTIRRDCGDGIAVGGLGGPPA